jgi:23S rRNA pseudouridine2605 synthase
MSEKLQKVLARAGLGSRREIEGWIAAGLVRVNGQLATIGDRVDLKDQISVRGRLIKAQELLTPSTQVLLYNKPEDELVTRSDEKGRETVFSRLPKPEAGRWIAIGRLDVNTTGLLLLTNNGELANRLMHPSHEVERTYLVRVFGEVSNEVIALLLKGVPLDDGMARFDAVEPLKGMEPTNSINRWYKVMLREGRNREVRRLWESQGVRVSRLKRIAFGQISLPKTLKLGHSQLASIEQVNSLLLSVGLPAQPVLVHERKLRNMRPSYRTSETRQSVSRSKAKAQEESRTSYQVDQGKAKVALSLASKRRARRTWRDDADEYID